MITWSKYAWAYKHADKVNSMNHSGINGECESLKDNLQFSHKIEEIFETSRFLLHHPIQVVTLPDWDLGSGKCQQLEIYL